MHNQNIIGVVTDELFRIFDCLNKDYFDGVLPHPVITIQKSPRGTANGWFSAKPIWKNINSDDIRYELNICAEHLARNPVDIVETMQHEMCHFMNCVNGVNDCNLQIHNKKFKTMAESKDLTVGKTDDTGFGYTQATDKFIQYVKDVVKPSDSVFEYFRVMTLSDKDKDKDKKPRKKTMVKHVCPKCSETAKAKYETKLICGNCEVPFEAESPETEDDD